MSKRPLGELDTLTHIGWPRVPVCVRSPATVRKQRSLLSLWGKLPGTSLYLPEGQRDAFAQACNTEGLMHGNQGMCSHKSPECSSLTPPLRYRFAPESSATCVFPRHGKMCWPRGTLVPHS